MDINKKLLKDVNSGVNVIIARFLVVVFAIVLVVAVLSYTGIFLTTMSQINILLLAAVPEALFGLLVLCLKSLRNDARTKYILCTLMCFQAFAVAMAGYSYAGTIVLLMPILLDSLYPKSRMNGVVSVVMMLCGLVVPPLALVAGFWDGEYYEFLYDLSFARLMDTATLSDEMLTLQEQVIDAIRFCSSQNILIIGGFALIGRLVYRQANKSFDSQLDVIRLSETDELTGLLNRNSYERRLNEPEAFRTGGLACFYFDVNGLHEMNNTKGHKAGDLMLQFIGKQIQNAFGADNTFRIGGDEYVAFCYDTKPEALSAVINSLETAFASQNYHVAIGCARGIVPDGVSAMVQRAEQNMYQAKNSYYGTQNRSR